MEPLVGASGQHGPFHGRLRLRQTIATITHRLIVVDEYSDIEESGVRMTTAMMIA
jgi:hypothetical protein